MSFYVLCVFYVCPLVTVSFFLLICVLFSLFYFSFFSIFYYVYSSPKPGHRHWYFFFFFFFSLSSSSPRYYSYNTIKLFLKKDSLTKKRKRNYLVQTYTFFYSLHRAKNEEERKNCIVQCDENLCAWKTLMHVHIITTCMKCMVRWFIPTKNCSERKQVTSLNINT